MFKQITKLLIFGFIFFVSPKIFCIEIKHNPEKHYLEASLEKGHGNYNNKDGSIMFSPGNPASGKPNSFLLTSNHAKKIITAIEKIKKFSNTDDWLKYLSNTDTYRLNLDKLKELNAEIINENTDLNNTKPNTLYLDLKSDTNALRNIVYNKAKIWSQKKLTVVIEEEKQLIRKKKEHEKKEQQKDR